MMKLVFSLYAQSMICNIILYCIIVIYNNVNNTVNNNDIISVIRSYIISNIFCRYIFTILFFFYSRKFTNRVILLRYYDDVRLSWFFFFPRHYVCTNEHVITLFGFRCYCGFSRSLSARGLPRNRRNCRRRAPCARIHYIIMLCAASIAYIILL